jgi:O-antigen/teichoic acid export membrane protein
MVQVAADLGLYLTLTRAIAEQPEREREYIGNVVALRLVIVTVLFTVSAAAVYLFWPAPSVLPAYLLVALGCTAQSISQLFMGIYQKYSLIWRATAGDVAGRAAQVAGILAASAHATLTAMTGFFALSGLAAALLHYVLLPAAVKVRLSFAWPLWRRLLADALPLGALLLFNAVYFRIDILLLSFFQPGEQTGLYGLAYRLIESALFLPAMFGGLLLPRLSAAWQQQKQAVFERYLAQGLFAALWAAAFIVPSLIVLARPIVLFIGGPEYQAAAPLLQVLAVALGAMFLGNIFGFSLVARHEQKSLLLLAAGLAAFNLTLNLLLLPRFGALAAACITVATELVAVSTAALLSHRLTRLVLPLPLLARLPVAVAATLVTYWALPSAWPVLPVLCAGAAVFLLSSWWLQLLTRESVGTLLAAS